MKRALGGETLPLSSLSLFARLDELPVYTTAAQFASLRLGNSNGICLWFLAREEEEERILSKSDMQITKAHGP